MNEIMYFDNQEKLDGKILNEILAQRQTLDFDKFSVDDVQKALKNEYKTIQDFQALLSPAASLVLEELMQASKACKERYFGKNIYLFTPLYISNYCDNLCSYCGFHCKNKIKRAKLNENDLEAELNNIAKEGFEEILILTGESQTQSPIEYIANACNKASKIFKSVGVEIYPVNTNEYKLLHKNNVDYVTVFQETYNPKIYAKFHLQGQKCAFAYRLESQERALKAGMRGVAFGALFGLDEWRKDAFCVGLHANLLQQKYPQAEISLSVPRLRPIINNAKINPKDVREKELVQIICAYRLFLPFANITLSTRESIKFRNNAMKFGITKLSAGVKVGIGEHSDSTNEGDGQFEINDDRNAAQIRQIIKEQGLTSIESEHIFLK